MAAAAAHSGAPSEADDWTPLSSVRPSVLIPIVEFWKTSATHALPDEENSTDDDDSSCCEDPAAKQDAPPLPPPVPFADDPGKLVYRVIDSDGLSTATVGERSTFSIGAYDPISGERRRAPHSVNEGGSHGFRVQLSGTAVTRARVFYEDDGTFMCEYRVTQTGKYRISVLRHGTPLAGSPYTVVAKAAAGGLNDWKQKRTTEVSTLRQKRAAVKASANVPRPPRAPSPRIMIAEQLEKAYELAIEIARRDREDSARSTTETVASGSGAASMDEHVLAV